MGAIESFERTLFPNEVIRFIGSGGESLIKADSDAPTTRMDVGDRLIGIGMTHLVESMSRPSGPDATHLPAVAAGNSVKIAARAIELTGKEQSANGFDFWFEPLPPIEFSDLIRGVSGSRVHLDPESIPAGTFVLSYVDEKPDYTLGTVGESVVSNWERATKGERHWNVGVGKEDDFWMARFPSDDIGLLAYLPPWETVGEIRFGLSILEGSRGWSEFETVMARTPGGRETRHHFYLQGAAAGVQGLDSPFPIGLRTQILFHPTSSSPA